METKHCFDCKLFNVCVVNDKLKDAAKYFVPLSKNKGIYVEVQALIAKDCTMFEKINDETTVDDDTDVVHFECQDCGALEILPNGVKCIECEMCGSKDIATIDLNNSSECE